jgi:membrane-bound lytic murein transglycosylase F
MILLSCMLSTCSYPPSLLEQIIGSGELRVVTRNTPVTFYYGTDEPRGIDYELARGFAEHLGVQLKIYSADQLRQILPDVQGGKAHIGAADLTITGAREQAVDFGPAYQRAEPLVIYRRGKQRPRKVEDLVGGRLEVTAGSAYVSELEEARKRVPALGWREEPAAGAEELIRRVASGEIDYTIVGSNVFALLRQLHPEARAAFELSASKPVGWALPKTHDTSLREAVGAYFAEIQSTGRLQKILDRYYYPSRDFDYVGARAFIRHVDSRLPEYRNFFRRAAFANGIDWRLLAAIAYQESHWNPKAVSPTGVKGIMMLTRLTAAMVGVKDRNDPRESIFGGARYFVRVQKKIPQRISAPDRTWLALAAYNVGYGHLEDARILTQSQGGDPDRWEDVRQRLPLLSEEKWYRRVARGYARGSEPVLYVDNIRRYYELLQWLTSREILTEDEQPATDTATATG